MSPFRSLYQDLLQDDSYGYQINKAILEKTDGQYELKEATLYTAFRRLENAGYIAQGLTLKLTELGLAACWQTINDADEAKKALEEDTDKVVACVVAFGYRDPDNDEKAVDKKSLDDMTDGFKYGQDIDTDHWGGSIEDALRAVCHSQSFQNLQPYKIIVDYDQISLIGLPDDMTSEADRLLNYGIVMFNFYSVLWAVRPTTPRWSFEPVTDRDLKLPKDVTYVAKCKI